MKKIHATLEKLGFNKNEIKIYISSLSLGQNTASILGKKSSINRSTAQYTCHSLVEKGVLSVVQQGNKFLYTAENPEKLISIVNKEYNVLEKKMTSTREAVSELQNMLSPTLKLPNVKYYSGVDEIIHLIGDVLEYKETFYGVIELTDQMHPEITRYINDVYIPTREKYKIHTKAIFNDNERSRNYQKIDSKLNRESLCIPKDSFPFESCLHIYGNKVAFYSYNYNDMTGVLIENEYIKSIMFSLYKLSWNYALTLDINKDCNYKSF